MTPTAARSLSSSLASDQPEQALSVARGIDAPWFRCQALSCVARYWPDDKYTRLLEEAVDAANSQDQIFNQVAVSAWPIRAYLERGNQTVAAKLLAKCTQEANTIENMGSRSEAIFSIFEASKPFPFEIWKSLFWALVEAAEPALAWRQQRNLKNAIAMVASERPELVQQTLKKMIDRKNLRVIERYLENPIHLEPRKYF